MGEPQPIETAPRDETDVLLFGSDGGRPRPPIVAGWYTRHTDLPGWYAHDNPDKPIAMQPKWWMLLPEVSP